MADADPALQPVYCGYSRVSGQGGRGEADQQGNGEHQKTVQGSVQLGVTRWLLLSRLTFTILGRPTIVLVPAQEVRCQASIHLYPWI